MHLRSMRAQSVTIPAALTRIDFAEGETIWTESSHKYRAEEVLEMAKRTGFRCEGQWIDEEWPFAQNSADLRLADAIVHAHLIALRLFRIALLGFELLDAPDQAAEPGVSAGEVGIPHRQNLRALIDAFESFFGFRNSFDRRDPELLRARRMQRDLHALPAVFHPHRRPRQVPLKRRSCRPSGVSKKRSGHRARVN